MMYFFVYFLKKFYFYTNVHICPLLFLFKKIGFNEIYEPIRNDIFIKKAPKNIGV